MVKGWTLTDQDLTGDGEQVLTLQALIRMRMDERGWSYGELERRSRRAAGPRGGGLTKGRWQQIGTGVRMTAFPDPASLQLMAAVLEVDITTVLLAAGQTLGLDARRRGPNFAHLLPAGVDELPEQMRDGLLTIIRAAVAQVTASQTDESDVHDVDQTLEWSKSQYPARRNVVGTERDRDV